MEHQFCEKHFLNSLEGRLDAQEDAEVLAHLASCEQCASSLEQFKAISQLENQLAQQSTSTSEILAIEVMESIEELEQSSDGFIEFVLGIPNKVAALSTAGLALLLLICFTPYFFETSLNSFDKSQRLARTPSSETETTEILVAKVDLPVGTHLTRAHFASISVPIDNIDESVMRAASFSDFEDQYAVQSISAKQPLQRAALAEFPPSPDFSIPAGSRALTLDLPTDSGLSDLLKPGHYVDVLLTYRRDKPLLITVARALRVASITPVKRLVQQNTENQTEERNEKGTVKHSVKRTLVTVVASIEIAKKLELARDVGTLGLSLVNEPSADELEKYEEKPFGLEELLPEEKNYDLLDSDRLFQGVPVSEV